MPHQPRIRLSICIPVYNFGAFIGQTLESIIRQATDEVEIVVLDGASTDDTAEVVGRYQERHPRIRYHRAEKKGGIDRDMAIAIGMGSGEYCWPFSGDDVMRKGAIDRLFAELRSGCDVYLLESMLCDFHLKPKSLHQLFELTAPRTFRLQDAADRREYFRLAKNTAAFFSFCSAVVIKKARWDAVPADESFVGSCWAHAARIFAMLPAGLVVRYLPGPFLDKRGDNDSFLTDGFTSRFAITIDGYHRIADTFLKHESDEAAHVRRAVRAELPLVFWIVARLEIEDRNRRDQLPLYRRLVSKNYADASSGWLSRLACIAVPVPALRIALRALRAWSGWRSGGRHGRQLAGD